MRDDLEQVVAEDLGAGHPVALRPESRRVGYDAAAAFLGIKVGTLRSMVSRGQVPHIRLSARLVVFDLQTLSEFIDSKRVGAR